MKTSVGAYLKDKSYVGRGLLLGLSENGKRAVFAYFISGRSANSRNRVFVEDGEGLRTEPFDSSKVEDPSLIIYSPVKTVGKDVIVTNGDQTDTVEEFLKRGKDFRSALKTRKFEPDAPNFTPRISSVLHIGEPLTYEISILKSEDEKGTRCSRFLFEYEAIAGEGHFISTYSDDGAPLPAFQGEPVAVAVPDDLSVLADEIWASLNEERKISLYCRAIDLKTGEKENILYNQNKR